MLEYWSFDIICSSKLTVLRSKTETVPFSEQIANINLLLTEREGRTGEYWPEVVAVRTERMRGPYKTTEGQYSPVRLELARLVSSLLYGTLGWCLFVFC